MHMIYLSDAQDNPAGIVRVGCTPSNPEPISLRAPRYPTQGIGFDIGLTLTIEQARAVANLLRDAADALAAARDLPSNARLVADEAIDRR